MRMQWSDEQQRVRSRFVELGCNIRKRADECRAKSCFDIESWREIADAGFFGLPIAARYGGGEQSWWELAAALEGLSSTAGDFGFLLSTIAHLGAVKIISEEGSEAQKMKYLPRLVRGSVAATATTESTGGSDVARIFAAARGEGSALRLTGTKTHITNAPIADIFIVLGRIPSLGQKRDITIFLLERNVEGLSTGDPERTLGNVTSPTGDIDLREVAIAPDRVLGRPGDGLNLLYGMLTLDRLLYALVAAGYLEPLLQRALDFGDMRCSFGKRLSENQYIQDKIVLMKVSMEQARFLAYAALDRMLTRSPEALLMSSIAKLVGTEDLWRSAYEFLQLHGHRGYMNGPVAQVLCDTVAARIAGGTSEMQKINIFKQLEKQQLGRRNSSVFNGEATA